MQTINHPLSTNGQPQSQASLNSQRASILLRLVQRAYLMDGRDVPNPRTEEGKDWWREVLEAWADALADIPDDHLIGAFSRANRSHKGSYLLKPGDVLTAYGDMVDERLELARTQYADTSFGMEQPAVADTFNLWPLCQLLCQVEDRLDGSRGKIGGMRMFGMIKLALQTYRWYQLPMHELLNFVRDLAAGQKGDWADFQDALLPVEAWEVQG
jgi:hypothetical protein